MLEQTDTLETQVCRRAAVRYSGPSASPARLGGGSPEGERSVRVHNLSTTGIGLLLDGPALAAMPLDIDLVTEAGTRVTLRGRPVHATRRVDGRWLVGYQLLQPLSAEEMESLRFRDRA